MDSFNIDIRIERENVRAIMRAVPSTIGKIEGIGSIKVSVKRRIC
jgi:hypothetical protein